MAYDKFSTQKVFRNPSANILCNKILDDITTQFSANSLAVSGEVSKMIQGQALADAKVIPFITADPDVYNYLFKNLQSILPVLTQLSFKNRIQVVSDVAYFEFWFDAAATSVDMNGIYCEDNYGGSVTITSPYDIVLSDPQEFTSSQENELYIQSWKLDKQSPYHMFYLAGSSGPAPLDVNVAIQDHLSTDDADVYSEFYARAYCYVFSAENPLVVVSGGGNMTDPATDGLLLTANNLNQLISVSFDNLSLTSPGYYFGLIKFQVDGIRKDTGFKDEAISWITLNLDLTILGEHEVAFTKEKMMFSHVKDAAPLAAQQFDIITGDDFEILVPSYFDLSGGNIVFQETTPQGENKYTGTGSQTLNVALNASFNDQVGAEFSGQFRLFNNSWYALHQSRRGQLHDYIDFTAFLMDAEGFQVNPEALIFFSIKDVQEAATQFLDVVSTQPFNINYPFWLQVSPTSGEIFENISVKPISSSNLVSGTYEGNITFVSADAQIEVPVILKVVESIDEAFEIDKINFTDDNKEETHLYSNNPNNRASLDLTVKSYDFKGFSSSGSQSAKLAFFKDETSIHIGEMVARRMKKLNSPGDIGFKIYDLENEQVQLFEIFKYYRPASVDINLKIELRGNGYVYHTKDFEEVLYVKGRKPQQFFDDYGILNVNTTPVRVTRNSQALFNFLRRYLQHEIKIYRNDNIYKTITHSPGNNSLFGLAMFFSDFNPGDVIDVRLAKDEVENFVQQYVMFPEGKYSNHIVFLTEHYVLESYEFTGAFSFSSDYKMISSKTYSQLVEYIENLESDKEQRLIINTGWILKSNQLIIDSILRAKRAWFMKDGKEISITPVDKKITNEDSEAGLYEYDVEFIINRENDLEVYTS